MCLLTVADVHLRKQVHLVLTYNITVIHLSDRCGHKRTVMILILLIYIHNSMECRYTTPTDAAWLNTHTPTHCMGH